MHQKFKLSNGLTVVHQKLEGYQSLSIGVWVKVGSVNENEHNNGISHFIEHMLFKGTKNRSAQEIALQVDRIGGEINAYTSKECTCYYTKTLGSDLDIALDILSDMVFNPLFLDEHIETEKTVIEDEINMYEDSAEELVADLLQDVTFVNHPLSLPILGNKESIRLFTREILQAYYQAYYQPSNMIVSIAGSYDPEVLESKIKAYFGHAVNVHQSTQPIMMAPTFNKGLAHKKKENEQIQVSLDFPGIPFEDELSYDMTLLSNVLGGTNSSILFQKIREEKGLSYSIYSEPCFYDTIGTLNISFGVSKENLEETLAILFSEVSSFKSNGLDAHVLQDAKAQLKGSVLLSLEGSEHVMDWIGRTELFAHKEKDLEAILTKIETISLEGVSKLKTRVFGSAMFSMAIVGDIGYKEAKRLYEKYTQEIGGNS